MGHKEYDVLEVVDVLRRYLKGDSIRAIARSKGMDRNTVRKYLRVAEERGLSPEFRGDVDEMAYRIFRAVHPERGDVTRQLVLPVSGKLRLLDFPNLLPCQGRRSRREAIIILDTAGGCKELELAVACQQP